MIKCKLTSENLFFLKDLLTSKLNTIYYKKGNYITDKRNEIESILNKLYSESIDLPQCNLKLEKSEIATILEILIEYRRTYPMNGCVLSNYFDHLYRIYKPEHKFIFNNKELKEIVNSLRFSIDVLSVIGVSKKEKILNLKPLIEKIDDLKKGEDEYFIVRSITND